MILGLTRVGWLCYLGCSSASISSDPIHTNPVMIHFFTLLFFIGWCVYTFFAAPFTGPDDYTGL